MLLATLLCCAHCAGTGQYVWVDDLPDTPTGSPTDQYVLTPGDMISIRVYNQEAMSTRGRIRADGRISMPFLNDVQAAGYSPPVLAAQLQTRLKEYVNVPVVTVSLEEPKLLSISVLGDVAKQGVLNVEPSARLVQVLAMAGGLNDFAHKDRIFVVRQRAAAQGGPQRIRFTLSQILRAEGKAGTFGLKNGDAIVVE